MAKIMLVEDDNNLREIYGARLLAEGYEIVSAKDGEEALAMAVKEKPDLIISDIMMPKISGFDMLDILRTTAETKNTKVIMMTALSQSEDKDRAGKLGADRYLVKSQVTLEDVAKAAQEVLAGTPASPAPATPADPAAAPAPTPAAEPAATPAPAAPATPTPTATPEPATSDSATPTTPAATPANPAPTPTEPATTPATPAPTPTEPTTPAPAPTPAAEPAATPAPAAPANESSTENKKVLEDAMAKLSSNTTAPEPKSEEGKSSTIRPGEHPPTSVHTKVIKPINDLSKQEDNLQKLIAEEESKEQAQAAGQPASPVISDITAAPEKPAETQTPQPTTTEQDSNPTPPAAAPQA
jgi:CheY-like chemotaxis protein